MAIVIFKIIKVTSEAFNGPRYFAHVPGMGYAIIPRDSAEDDRRILKFNMESPYDRAELVTRMTQIEREYPGHVVTSINAMGSPE